MAITAQALRLQAQLDAHVQQVTDAQTRALTAAWVYAWAEVSADLQDTLEELLADRGVVSRATMARSLRLRAVLGQVADRLDGLASLAGVRITSDLGAVVDAAAEAQRGILAAQLPPLLTDEFAALVDRRLDDAALDAIVRRTTQQITSRTQPLSAEAEDVVRRELVRAVSVGENPRVTARRMVRRAEKGFNGGLTRAMNISATEILDAHRAAAKVQQDRNAEVLQGWIWLCHLSPRTCPSCLVKHGTLHPLTEAGPEDHPQGRCSRMAKVKPWADLGFDVEEPEDQVADARAWFDALSEAERVAIMGRTRLDLLNAGKVDWDDLTTCRTTPEWRDSWVLTPIGDLVGQPSGSRRVS
jgi:hypothetical protein